MSIPKECQVKGCNTEGTLIPLVKVWAPNRRGQPVTSHINLPLCPAHAAETKLDGLVTDQFKGLVEGSLKALGRVMPDWKLTELEMVPIGDVPANLFD